MTEAERGTGSHTVGTACTSYDRGWKAGGTPVALEPRGQTGCGPLSLRPGRLHPTPAQPSYRQPPVSTMPRPRPLTIVTVVVHQDDLLEELGGRVVDHAVHGAQDDRQRLVDKDEDHGDLGQVLGIAHVSAPAGDMVWGVVRVGRTGPWEPGAPFEGYWTRLWSYNQTSRVYRGQSCSRKKLVTVTQHPAHTQPLCPPSSQQPQEMNVPILQTGASPWAMSAGAGIPTPAVSFRSTLGTALPDTAEEPGTAKEPATLMGSHFPPWLAAGSEPLVRISKGRGLCVTVTFIWTVVLSEGDFITQKNAF